MKRPRRVEDDPVVEEVRQIRQKLWKEAGCTVEGYIRLVEERAKERKAKARISGNHRTSKPKRVKTVSRSKRK